VTGVQTCALPISLEMMPTVAPACAAANAALWPASPAPMINTSWDGTTGDSI
jgi:hypothetical protein